MKKFLVIDATGRDATKSHTKKLAEKLLAKIAKDGREIVILDLYQQDIPFLDNAILLARHDATQKTEVTNKCEKLLNEFMAADAYVFIFPTWNWSVPAILKAYLDIILVSGKLFVYKGLSIEGQLKGKTAFLVNTTGGPVVAPFFSRLLKATNGVEYMELIVKIMGIRDIRKLVIDGMSYRFKNPKTQTAFDEEQFDKKADVLVAKIDTSLK
ncbi:FMN-dependent NADH-azoreductase 2 [Erysipelotrichaceae bacterium]|nr:FMN-dependent NADH-azoreductase 2 [Erysipelotrichaceae bacterium]